MELFYATLQSGFASLASYLAAHVLLCLVPALFVAGGLSALVPQQSIVRFLGQGGLLILRRRVPAVCLQSVHAQFNLSSLGIYSKGAGLGPAVTFLFFAPAANILALSYTGVALGADFAIARVVLSLSFGYWHDHGAVVP